MHESYMTVGYLGGGGMRRAIPGIAVLAAGLLYLTGCTAGGAPAGAPAPSADGIGPITFAIGKDNSGWLQGVITGWNAEFASNGWIIPLPQSQFPLGDFLKPAVDTAMYQGRLYAVPDYSNADLLYYRKDVLAKAGQQPPRTWAQLRQLARTVAPRYGLYGYAGTFAPYEGLTVNFAGAVQSAGGSILSPEGTRVTVNSDKALAGLEFLVNGFRQGWIPKITLSY